MVEAEEVEDAMDEERGQLCSKRAARRFGLSIGRFSRDHNVSEQIRRERRKQPLPHRK